MGYANAVRFKVENGNKIIVGNMCGDHNIPSGTPIFRKIVFSVAAWGEERNSCDTKLYAEIKELGFLFIYMDIEAIMHRHHDGNYTNIRKDGIYGKK